MAKSSSRKKPICQIGDRILAPGGKWGTVTSTSHTSIIPYKVQWDNGHEATYKKAELERYQIHPPEPEAEDIDEEDSAQLNLSDICREEEWKVGDRVTTLSTSDWQPGELIITEADDTENIKVESPSFPGRPAVIAARFLQRWNPSPSSTCVAVSESASPSPVSNSEDLNSLDCVKETNGANQSSSSDIPECQSSQMSSATTGQAETSTAVAQISALSQPRHPAPLSQSKEKDSEPQTSETVSQQCYERSQASNPDILPLKTLEDSLAVPISEGSKSDTLSGYSISFPAAGTMQSGKWFPADILEAPSLENDCFWLDSPGALSSDTSHAPGQSRLEAQLKKLDLIDKGQVCNPEWLTLTFGIPSQWTNPLELRAATELLENSEKPSETASILAWQRWRCEESSTSTASLKTEEELTPVDDSAVGKHFWYDQGTVAVEVLAVQNFRKTPRSKELIKVARCRPWWVYENGERVRSDMIVAALSELTELEEEDFSSLIPERALVDEPSPLEKCPSCDQNLLTLDDGCGICGWMPSERPVVEDSSSLQKPETHTERACQTGSLYKDTKWQNTKLGRIEYPKVNGYRDPENEDHWYWYLSYVVKDSRHKKASAKGNGGFKDCTAYVPRGNLPLVRSLIRHSVPVEVTLEVVGLKFCWLVFKGSWAIGEVKPEACPQLCLISMDEKQVLIIPSSEWGELRVEARAAKRRVINEAIAENKNLTYIKEKLDAQRVPETDHRAVSSTRTD